MYKSSSTSSSPIQTMSESNGSYLLTPNGLNRLSDNDSTNSDSGLTITLRDKKKLNKMDNSIKSNKNNTSAKKALRRLNGSNCEVQSDSTILKVIPHLFERYIEVVDSKTKESCQVMMCKLCRFLLKKNTDILLGHICKQKDIERFQAIPIINNQLIFRSKPKNRATPIWDEFEEVIEPATSILLGYARCKRCLEIIKTSDPKSIPSVLRRHVPLCSNGPFPSSFLGNSYRSENHSNNSNKNSNNNSNNHNHNNTLNTITNTNLNINTSAHNLNNFLTELSTNGLLGALNKNLTANLTSNLAKNLNNSAINTLTNNSNNRKSMNNVNNLANSVTILPVNNLSSVNLASLTNASQLSNTAPQSMSIVTSASSKMNHLKNEFRERCIEFCYKELISFETLHSPSFKRLSQTLMLLGSVNTRQPQLPDTSQLYDQMHSKYSTLRFQIKNEIQLEMCKNVGGALVCDSQDNLCVLATYFISNSWKLREIVLNADAYGNDINHFITNTLNDYHLNEEDKICKFTFVSKGGHFDGVSLSLSSIAHTIDHIINVTIFFDDTYTELIESCRLVCTDLGIEVKLEAIVENVDWIVKYEILRHVLINIDKYELRNYPLNFELIEFLVYLLTPFRNASYELRHCSKHPTLNHVLLWYYKIMKLLEDDEKDFDKKEDDDDEELSDRTIISLTKKSIREAVEEHFDLHLLHKIAVFLWPNFRSLKMLNVDERKKVHEEVKKLIDCRVSKDLDKKDYNLPTIAKKARTDFSDWEEDSSPIICQDEIQRYLNENLSTCDETSLLSWWKDHQTKFPSLAQLARWILSIPASVTLIEKFKLNNSPKINEEILFLHCNLHDK